MLKLNSISKQIILLLALITLINPAYSQKPDDSPNEKQILLNVGSGPHKTSFSLGGRYWFFGASIGVTGISSNVPNYVTDYYLEQSKPKGTELKKYSSTVVCGDVSVYYDISDFSLYGTVGFYSQLDTLLDYDYKTNYYYRHTPYASENVSGITYGVGFQYLLESIAEDYMFFKPLVVGLGYHNKYGISFQLGYHWY
jgi:hypothetical protein